MFATEKNVHFMNLNWNTNRKCITYSTKNEIKWTKFIKFIFVTKKRSCNENASLLVIIQIRLFGIKNI